MEFYAIVIKTLTDLYYIECSTFMFIIVAFFYLLLISTTISSRLLLE